MGLSGSYIVCEWHNIKVHCDKLRKYNKKPRVTTKNIIQKRMTKHLLEELKFYVIKNTINQNKAGKEEEKPQNSEQIENKS